MTIGNAITRARHQLTCRHITSASLDAEVLLSFVLKKPKEFLLTHPEKEITKKQNISFQSLIKRRLKHEPVAYLVHHKQFYGLDFYVDRRVLIPRPETETLVTLVIKEVTQRTKDQKQITIVDIGTGSGCIALALAKHLPEARIIATDCSKKALAVAKRNSRQNQARIKLCRSNLLKPLKGLKIDYFCANLPYLSPQYLKKLPPKDEFQALRYEPRQALIGEKIFEKFFQQMKDFAFQPAAIFLEIDPCHFRSIDKIIKKYLPSYCLKPISHHPGQVNFLIIRK